MPKDNDEKYWTPEKIKMMAGLGSVIFLFLIDRLLKFLALNYWNGKEFVFVNGFFRVELFENYGFAFGLFSQTNWPRFQEVIIVFSLIAIGGLLYYLLILNQKKSEGFLKICLWLIAAGGISNLFDRLKYGFVVDYLGFFYFSVLNLADIMISSGIIIMILLKFFPKKIFFDF